MILLFLDTNVPMHADDQPEPLKEPGYTEPMGIVSADHGFDRRPDLKRLEPASLSAWRQRVEA
jgi:hypothetical protein